MARDWESHLYFEHRPLTAVLLDPLLRDLAATGLRLGGSTAEAHPALSGFVLDGETAAARLDDFDLLLRSKEPPVGPGYGILPFQVSREGLPQAEASLTFARPDPATGLDGVSLVVDGALFREHESAALDLTFEWFIILCRRLDAVYGWADWETATFLVAAPSRRDVRAGTISRLLRFNAIRPPLLLPVALDLVESSPRFRRLDNGTVAFEAHERPAQSGG